MPSGVNFSVLEAGPVRSVRTPIETVDPELDEPEPELPAAVGAVVPLFEELLHAASSTIDRATAATRSPVRDTWFLPLGTLSPFSAST
jgi:hypothetical protein